MTEPEALTAVPEGYEVDLWLSLGECDFGDADDPTYPTLLASNGARHVATGVILGAFRDTEGDGQPNPAATLDDTTGAPDDEDGVAFGVITPLGGFVTVTVTADCNLNAWVDWNTDGDWDDAGEQVFTDETLLLAGSPHVLPITPAAGAARNTNLVSRWRVNAAGGLAYTGVADDGEVEDYNSLQVVCHVPDVVNDPNLAAQAELIANGFEIGNVTAECNDLIPDGNVISTDPPFCNYPECGSVVDIVVSTGPCEEECYAGQPDYDVWVAVGKPECWCYPRQCHGDADGKVQGGGPAGLRYVDTDDLDILAAGWQVKEPPKGPGIQSITGPNGDPGACADFAHNVQGGGPAGLRYVDTDDLDILALYWQVKEPPKGLGVPADCEPGNRTPAP